MLIRLVAVWCVNEVVRHAVAERAVGPENYGDATVRASEFNVKARPKGRLPCRRAARPDPAIGCFCVFHAAGSNDRYRYMAAGQRCARRACTPHAMLWIPSSPVFHVANSPIGAVICMYADLSLGSTLYGAKKGSISSKIAPSRLHRSHVG